MALERWRPLAGVAEGRKDWKGPWALSPWRLHEVERAKAEWDSSPLQIRKRAVAILRRKDGCELAVIWEAASGRAVWVKPQIQRLQIAKGKWVHVGLSRKGPDPSEGRCEMLAAFGPEERMPYWAAEPACAHGQFAPLANNATELLNLVDQHEVRTGIVDERGAIHCKRAKP